MKIVAIIQARMGSTRLPGKVLKQVLGKPLLQYQLERVKRANYIDDIIVATTNQKKDDDIERFCQQQKIQVYRGSEQDVLGRYKEAADQTNATTIVRLTADCPLIAPEIIDSVIQRYKQRPHPLLYVSNTMKRTFPRGMDVEVFSNEALTHAYKLANVARDREHVTSYMVKHPHVFHVVNVEHMLDLSHHRWTVDTPEDFTLIKKLLEAIYPAKQHFTMEDILDVLNLHPTWSAINAHIEQKEV